MDRFTFRHTTRGAAAGTKRSAIIGVVASGNLEMLIERNLAETECVVDISTPILGFKEVWSDVVADFVGRVSPGGLHISINDGGARPDMVMLRLLQGARVMEHGDA